MPFQLSPGVQIVEKDLTNIIPAVATSIGGFAGPFAWGPVLDATLVSSENQLVARFGKPQEDSAAISNAPYWFTAANFLSYTNNLQVVRVDCANARNAVAVQSGTVAGVTISDAGADYDQATTVVTFSAPSIAGGIPATGTATVEAGEITAIVVTNPGSGYTTSPSVTISNIGAGTGAGATAIASVAVGGIKINNLSVYNTNYVNGGGSFGEFAAKYPGELGNSLYVAMVDNIAFNKTTTTGGVTTYDFEYRGEFDSSPGTSSYAENLGGEDDELHIIIVDKDGLWTGTKGAILEKFSYVSKARDARKSDGTNNYYKDVLNNNSKYVWWMDHPVDGANWGSLAQGTSFDSLSAPVEISLSGGVTDHNPDVGDLTAAYDILANAELIDISLIPTGPVVAEVAKYVIQNVAESRMDCVAFASPTAAGLGGTGAPIIGADAVEDTVAFRNDVTFNVSSSYGVLDSGWKYQYDRYNDVYVWVPLNGDIAGLCARTDYTNDPWWSPGGLNRGQIKNVVRLSLNPNKAERDNLYKSGVNPVVSFPGQGTVLFGDKTLLSKPSAFDRINVRRLFIVLEKAIATAAKYQLFEFNDSFTRAMFKSMVEPFLRDVQGRRGVIDFRVKCDDVNNNGEVIDRNEFVADIFIKPARSINFITLNFIAARTGISFEEIGA